jgi:hypothetical protein
MQAEEITVSIVYTRPGFFEYADVPDEGGDQRSGGFLLSDVSGWRSGERKGFHYIYLKGLPVALHVLDEPTFERFCQELCLAAKRREE